MPPDRMPAPKPSATLHSLTITMCLFATPALADVTGPARAIDGVEHEGLPMTFEVLASGAVGALFVFALGYWREQWLRSKRIKAYKGALRAEIAECGRIASEYGPERVKAPLYRLPTVCYTHSFPGLLGEGMIGESEADALVKFYAEVETFNRALDLADFVSHGGNDKALDKQVGRILLKAKRIASPSGEFYKPAHSVVSK